MSYRLLSPGRFVLYPLALGILSGVWLYIGLVTLPTLQETAHTGFWVLTIANFLGGAGFILAFWFTWGVKSGKHLIFSGKQHTLEVEAFIMIQERNQLWCLLLTLGCIGVYLSSLASLPMNGQVTPTWGWYVLIFGTAASLAGVLTAVYLNRRVLFRRASRLRYTS